MEPHRKFSNKVTRGNVIVILTGFLIPIIYTVFNTENEFNLFLDFGWQVRNLRGEGMDPCNTRWHEVPAIANTNLPDQCQEEE